MPDFDDEPEPLTQDEIDAILSEQYLADLDAERAYAEIEAGTFTGWVGVTEAF